MTEHVLQISIEALAADFFAEYEVDAEGNVSHGPNAERASDAWSVIHSVLTWNPDAGWDLIRALLELAPTSADVEQVAAGPLEDLVRAHGREFVDRIAAEAERDARLREALSGVWGWDEVPTAVRDRLLRFVPDDIRDDWTQRAEQATASERPDHGSM